MNSTLSKFFTISAILVIATSAFADLANVPLAWDPNPEQDIAGYKVHWGTASGVYTQFDDVLQITDVGPEPDNWSSVLLRRHGVRSGGFGERLLPGGVHSRVGAAHPDSDSNTHGDSHTQSDPHPDSNSNSDSHRDSNSNPHTHTHSHPHTNANSNPNRHSNANSNPDPHTDSNSDPHTDSNSDSHTDSDSDPNPDRNSDPHSNPTATPTPTPILRLR